MGTVLKFEKISLEMKFLNMQLMEVTQNVEKKVSIVEMYLILAVLVNG